MTCNLASMNLSWQFLVANLVAGGDWVQTARPLFQQPCFTAMACGDLPWHKLALPTWPWVANILAGMVAACQIVATSLTAREHPILLRKTPLHHHLATHHRLYFLAAEALCREVNLTVPAGPGVADLLTTVPPAGEQLFALLPTRNRRTTVRAPPHDRLLAARARPLRSKRLAGWAWPRVALHDADVRAPGSSIIMGGGTLGSRICSPEGLGAGLPARVWGEEEVARGIPASAAEAGVGDVASRDVLHGLAPGAAPGGGRVGGVGDGGRGARPLANAGEVEDGEAAAAGPHGRRPPHHVVADHALHRPPGQLVLDLLNQLRHRPAPRRSCRRGVRGRERSPLLRRGSAVASAVAVVGRSPLLRRGVAVVGVRAALAAVVRTGVGVRVREGQVGGGVVMVVGGGVVVVVRGAVGGDRTGVGGGGGRRSSGSGPPYATGGGRGWVAAAPIGGGLHAAAGRET